MNLAQALIEALRSLTVNKLRSALTILGIVIGVAAVIAMISLGRGLQASVSEQLSGVGSTTLVVFSAPDPGIRAVDGTDGPDEGGTPDVFGRKHGLVLVTLCVSDGRGLAPASGAGNMGLFL